MGSRPNRNFDIRSPPEEVALFTGTEYPGIENSIWKAPVNIYKNFDGDPQSGDPVIKTS
jgi:hypothetical protein